MLVVIMDQRRDSRFKYSCVVRDILDTRLMKESNIL